MLRAARAHAVWQGREQIEVADVEAVAELALAHRRKASEPPAAPRPGGSSGPSTAGSPPRGSSASPVGAAGTGAGAGAGDAGALPPVPVPLQRVSLPRAWTSSELASARPAGGAGAAGKRRLRRYGQRTVPGGIDWFGTLLCTPRPQAQDVRRRARTVAAERLWLIALDCSSSMLRSGALGVAKGVAAALSAQAATAGARTALISFAGASAQARLDTRASTLAVAIDELGGGGGTPLRSALKAALGLCLRPAFRSAGTEKRLWILSDGRTRETVGDLRGSLRELAPLVVDCERGPVRLGRAQQLALTLGAGYAHLDALG
jgi:magnesium chelatase subunit D